MFHCFQLLLPISSCAATHGYTFPKDIDEVTVVYSVTAPDGRAVVPETEAGAATRPLLSST